jgi:hypothetical protein
LSVDYEEVNMTRFTRIAGTVRGGHRVALVAVLAVAFVAALSLGVSNAKALYTDCISPNFCLWHDSEYNGTRWDFDTTMYPTGQWVNVPSAARDEASALYDHRTNLARIQDASGHQDCINPGLNFRRANLANWNWPNTNITENDSITQIWLGTSTSC